MALSRVSFLFSFLCLPAVGSCSRTWRCAGRQLFLCVEVWGGLPTSGAPTAGPGLDGRVVQGGRLKFSSLRRRGFEPHSSQNETRARSLVAPRRACHFFPEPPPGPYGGCVAQWQSIGLQILRSPVRLWSHPEEGRPFCFGFVFCFAPRRAHARRSGAATPTAPKRRGAIIPSRPFG